MARLEEDKKMAAYSEKEKVGVQWTEDEDKVIIDNYEQFKELGESTYTGLLA
jgi:hypothetical protein